MDIPNLRWWGWGTLDQGYSLEGRTAFWPTLQKWIELPDEAIERETPPVPLEEIPMWPPRLDDPVLFSLRRRVGPLGLRRVTRSVVRSLVGTGAMLLVLHLMAPLGAWREPELIARNALVLGGCVGAGAAVYLFVTRVLGSRELRAILEAMRRKAD